MIPLHVIFALLDELRADTIELAENPDGRDAFAYGELAGRFRSIAQMRARIERLVEEANRERDDDNG